MNASLQASVSLEHSYERCVQIAREKAKHFHYGFKLLSDEERYRGICALYAFARLADDYSDDESDSQRALAQAKRLHEALDRGLAGNAEGIEILPAVVDTVRRFGIPARYLHELIEGTEMDATQRRYASWEETYRYCYRVASVVGMMTILVFGHEEPAGEGEVPSLQLAERTGIAFQLTNILRDIREDAGLGRIYLPLEDLRAFDISEGQVLAGEDSPAFRELVRFEVERARAYYEAAPELAGRIIKGSRMAFGGLVGIYRCLLEKIERRGYDVLSERVTLSTAEKLKLASGVALKSWLGQ